SCAALLAYDHLLTLSGEIQFVWGRKFSGATVVFVLNRYVTLCRAPIILTEMFSVVVYFIVAIFSTLRVYAIWNKDWRPALLVLLVGLCIPVANMYHYIPSVPGAFAWPLYGCGESTPLSDVQLAKALTAIIVAVAIAIHSCAIATDLLVLILTWVKTYHIKKLASILETEASFATLILRDGSLYLGAMLVLNVIDLVILRSDVLFDPLPVFIDVFTCILISRFMLNLRQIAGRGNDLPSASQLQATSRFSSVWFSPDIIGDLGASLSYAGFGGGLDEGFPGEEVGASSCDTTDLSDSVEGRPCSRSYPFLVCVTPVYRCIIDQRVSAYHYISTTLGGVGIAAFDRQQQSQRSFAELSNEISQAQVDLLHAQLAQFRSALAHYASTHRDRIRKEPSFRHAFQQMCTTIGVDPLAGPRKGGWWAEMLGLGDWQYELGVQIVDVCVSTRERNGGLIEIGELIRLVSKLRGVGGDVITEDDVMRSIKTLKPLNAGYEVIDVGGGKKMVRSVPKELDADQAVVLAIAQEDGGRVSESALMTRRGWTTERARAALANMLLRDGLCWLDEQDEFFGISYWVPSAMRWDE
ncbi:EAP30/Vps36 family-domain-containing protein, partial [Cubamyces lactineus]